MTAGPTSQGQDSCFIPKQSQWRGILNMTEMREKRRIQVAEHRYHFIFGANPDLENSGCLEMRREFQCGPIYNFISGRKAEFHQLLLASTNANSSSPLEDEDGGARRAENTGVDSVAVDVGARGGARCGAASGGSRSGDSCIRALYAGYSVLPANIHFFPHALHRQRRRLSLAQTPIQRLLLDAVLLTCGRGTGRRSLGGARALSKLRVKSGEYNKAVGRAGWAGGAKCSASPRSDDGGVHSAQLHIETLVFLVASGVEFVEERVGPAAGREAVFGWMAARSGGPQQDRQSGWKVLIDCGHIVGCAVKGASTQGWQEGAFLRNREAREWIASICQQS
ncbi:hypothetical protein C8J57DRAFT_1224159 [Mycena rebaudengoi]|nr:hypothetical protein C8J57DRAFT_1224159 [Mycena rebaudengoi]